MTRDPHPGSGVQQAVAALVAGLLAIALWIEVALSAEFQAFDIRVSYPLLFAAAALSFATFVTAATALRRLAGRGGPVRIIAIFGLVLGLVLSIAAFFPLLFALVSLLRP